MAVPPQVLAVDLGTSAMKAALVDYGGRISGWATRPVPLHVLPDGGVEQCPDDWWTALVEVAADLRGRYPDEWAQVGTICSSTQGEGTIPMGRGRQGDLVPLHDCLLWMDTRGEPALRRQFGGLPSVRGVSARRLARWLRLTGGAPSFSGKDPAAHMLYVRDEMPAVFEATEVFLNVLDYLTYRLTGEVVATVDSILTSWVTDNRDPGQIDYHPGLVADSGIPRDKLPPIVRCTQVVGALDGRAADELGLPRRVQVVAGSIDNTAAAIGAGTTRMRETHLYIGTSSWVAAHVPAKKTDVVHGIASVPCAVPDRYLLTALQATAGGNLTWVRDNVLQHDDPLVDAAENGRFFDACDEIVPRVPPGANGVLSMPWIHGERAPVDDNALRAGLVNVSLENNRSDILRAILEGVAYNTRWLLDPVERFMGERPRSIAFAGGGAQSDAWCQIVADVLDISVRRLSDPVQVNARGAAWIGAVGIGEVGFEDLPGLVAVDRTFRPDPASRGVYDEGFATFLELHKRLAPLYKRLNGAG